MLTHMAGLAAVVGALAAVVPQAQIPKPLTCPQLTYCSTTYYTDRSLTTMTGGLTINCIGLVSSWGTTSSYTRYTEVAC